MLISDKSARSSYQTLLESDRCIAFQTLGITYLLDILLRNEWGILFNRVAGHIAKDVITKYTIQANKAMNNVQIQVGTLRGDSLPAIKNFR